MDINNHVIKLCLDGTHAEFEGRIDAARKHYQQAWEAAENDYEACIAAHYVARHQANPEDEFKWNQEALKRADAVADSRVEPFYPSLYLNMGHAYELLGNQKEAQRYYDLAAELGVIHQQSKAQ
ncbi:MAG: hypothetical protein KDE48_19835 [Anaerolineales bacterium]|nr:hypothetical protein [Anaerolineales bacterium]